MIVGYLLLSLLCVHHAYAVGSLTVSGISSGGAMAVQFHVAHSSTVKGAGIVAGIPYYCAGGTIAGATACMQQPSTILLANLYAATTFAYSTFTIDSPSNLATSKVYVYAGTLDSTVSPATGVKVEQYYNHYVPSSSIKSVFNVASEHAFITKSFGNACPIKASPFINNCNYDQAGDILNHLLGTLLPPVAALASNIKTLKQAQFLPFLITREYAALAEDAYLYVPTKCTKGKGCRVHIALHGCAQTLEDIGTTFVDSAGYNGWAEANNIVILYPQAKATTVNPYGCWDWWGYTGTAYASKMGVQVRFLKDMSQHVLNTY